MPENRTFRLLGKADTGVELPGGASGFRSLSQSSNSSSSNLGFFDKWFIREYDFLKSRLEKTDVKPVDLLGETFSSHSSE